MIKNVPSQEDFTDSAVTYFNIAWDFVIKLISVLDDSELEFSDSDGKIKKEYWRAAQKQLSTALALTQQGVEFMLKGYICSISPYLLISRNPRDWPSKSNTINTNFSEFRTMDAQDLIKVHDTVSKKKIPKAFKEQFEKLRRKRNICLHTVDRKSTITVKEVLISILQASYDPTLESNWFEIRRYYLSQSPETIAYSDEYVYDQLLKEAQSVIGILDNKQTQYYFNFNKRQKKYSCLNCSWQCENFDANMKFAQLRPNDPHSTHIYCFVCNYTSDVNRLKCENTDCKGDVIGLFYGSEGYCLSCDQYWGEYE